MQPIIQVENVEYTYPGEEQPALRGVTLSIEPGTFTAVLGHNGSGKSTLAKHFNAILLPTSGRVLVDGMDTADEENLLRVRGTVGMVFQNPDNQIVANVVEDDVAFAPENLGVEPQEIRRRVDEALKQVGMYKYRTHAPHLLSGGQKQRVAIAGVIAMRPKCIVLDEPTAMLDPSGRREVVSTALKLCREQGITVVLITHHMDECIDADRLLVMSGGHVIADGKPKDVFAQRALLESEGLAVPVTTALLQDLRAEGLDVQTDVLSVEACAEDRIQDIIDIKSAESSTRFPHLLGSKAELVISLSLLWVAEHTICLGSLLELLLGILLFLLGLTLLTVGMIFDCQFAVSLLQFIGGSVLLHAQHLVIISLVCHYALNFDKNTSL